MFIGVYKHQLDAKNRFRIPAKLKDELGSSYLVTKGGNGCLYVLPQKVTDKLMEEFSKINIFNLEEQKPMRMFFSSSAMVEEDVQGRALLPTELKDFAKINKDIVIVGVGTKIEIWASEVWEEYSNDANDFDKMCKVLEKMGSKND